MSGQALVRRVRQLEGGGRSKPDNRIVQISASHNACFGLRADGSVYVCIYDGVIDEWLWHETHCTPGVKP